MSPSSTASLKALCRRPTMLPTVSAQPRINDGATKLAAPRNVDFVEARARAEGRDEMPPDYAFVVNPG